MSLDGESFLDFREPSSYFHSTICMHVAAHMIVKGLVQGVGFRWFVSRHAQTLGLRGFVANLHDGSVEIEVAGDRGMIEELIKQVRVGPRSAHVSNVHIEWIEGDTNEDQYSHFEIR